MLQDLQRLQERTLPLTAMLKSTMATTATLKQSYALQQGNHNLNQENVLSELQSCESHMEGHIVSVQLIEKKLEEILNIFCINRLFYLAGHIKASDLMIKQLVVVLNLRNRAISVDINHSMLSPTKDTVDGSATIRVVTLATLIYLPASFIAVC
jgi:hypothetical protein